jgi:hypothetical protein
MTKGVSKKLQRDDQRRKCTQAASVLAHAGTVARSFESNRRRLNLSFGHAEVAALPPAEQDGPLPPAHYPAKRVAIGKPQTAGSR